MPPARLVLVGTGRLRAHLERRVLAAGLALAVRFAGEVPHHAVAKWMRAADVLVLPSEAEGFPNVVREALACGRPVVATAVGDLPRVVTPAAGRLVAPADPAALAWAIAHVLAQRWDPAAIRAQATDMTWERNAEATVRFLATAMQGDRMTGESIVCFSKDWDGHPTSNTNVMRVLARTNRVLWLEFSRCAPRTRRAAATCAACCAVSRRRRGGRVGSRRISGWLAPSSCRCRTRPGRWP